MILLHDLPLGGILVFVLGAAPIIPIGALQKKQTQTHGQEELRGTNTSEDVARTPGQLKYAFNALL